MAIFADVEEASPSAPLVTAVLPVRLLRKLANVESTISQLLSLGQQTKVLKWKLAQVEELLLDLPDGYLEEWRAKVARWWANYAALGLDTAKDADTSGPATYSGPSVIIHRSFWNSQSRRSQSTSSRINSSRPLATESSLPSFPGPPSLGAVILSKDAIRCQLKNAFEMIDSVIDSEDIEGLERVLTMVATGDKLISTNHFWRDQALQDDLLAMALPKLPESMQRQFMKQYDQGLYRKTLWALDDYLKHKIVKYYEALRRVAKVQQQQMNRQKSDCVYCKSSDHLKQNCPKIKAQVCYRCFAAGHKAKFCKWSTGW